MKRECRDTDVNAFPLLDELDREHEARSRALGDIRNIYDTCGMMGLCPECRRKNAGRAIPLTYGCQRHYLAGTVRGVPDP